MVIDNKNFDLLHPSAPLKLHPPPPKLWEVIAKNVENQKLLFLELKAVCQERWWLVDEPIKPVDLVAAVWVCIEQLAAREHLDLLALEVKNSYSDVFEPIPHVDEMPNTVCCKITLKYASKLITTCNYSCPWKYCEAWSTLISKHLEAGCIRPSPSSHASPAFLVSKSDKAALPHWANDFRQLNVNTVMDCHPLPCVDDILADAGKGKIWSKIDMIYSFFHMKMDPESVHLTAVTTLLGLYECWSCHKGYKMHLWSTSDMLWKCCGHF